MPSQIHHVFSGGVLTLVVYRCGGSTGMGGWIQPIVTSFPFNFGLRKQPKHLKRCVWYVSGEERSICFSEGVFWLSLHGKRNGKASTAAQFTLDAHLTVMVIGYNKKGY